MSVEKERFAPVGFIGLGRMGAGMANNLLRAEVPIVAYDTDPSAADRLGARRATSPAELADAVETVLLCLPDAEAVREVLFGTDGVLSGARAGTLIVDHTTYNRTQTIAVGTEVQAQGARYADCPISGMPFRAADGTLTMMFGGRTEDFDACEPLLRIMGQFIVYCGELGAGQLMKAFNNIIYDVNIAVLAEILPLALKAGLKTDALAQTVTSASSRSFASEYFVPRILVGEFQDDFSMGAAYKDIVNVQQTATELQAMTPVVNAMIAVYQQAMARGLADQPKSALIKLYEAALGVRFRNTNTNTDPDSTPNPSMPNPSMPNPSMPDASMPDASMPDA